jgi:anaerobic ribonucleoside-triphosphate reductase
MYSKEVEKKLKFINDYKNASNAATGSKFDSNANVTSKNIATEQCELGKKDIIDLRRAIVCNYLKKNNGDEMANAYLDDLKNHRIYANDETSLFPYCCSISLYPYLLNGLKDLGGSSCPPKHANSFIGGMINLVFLVASQFAGAVAMPEFLTYFDHFLRKDYGEDYINHLDTSVEVTGGNSFTLRHRIEDWFQQFVYSINQPAGARNYQSPFTNIAYFDKYYFESIFKDFVFPDGDEPKWETTKELQKMFMKWFNAERNHEILTFPVETANILVADSDCAVFTLEDNSQLKLKLDDSIEVINSKTGLKETISVKTLASNIEAYEIIKNNQK